MQPCLISEHNTSPILRCELLVLVCERQSLLQMLFSEREVMSSYAAVQASIIQYTPYSSSRDFKIHQMFDVSRDHEWVLVRYASDFDRIIFAQGMMSSASWQIFDTPLLFKSVDPQLN
jgi:hypothetical protein